jgi:hypothetical protein
MKRFELSLKVLDKQYVDTLVIALARQGYAPYIGEDSVCFEISSEELTEIKL